ncbi:MAG: serine/threonine-protein kinase PknK, partial [Actinomycetia bacterium]|nr:serine/threonine-protein kinase PknK [Actinomycetes bacterium]
MHPRKESLGDMRTVDDSLELVTKGTSLPSRFEVRKELGSGGFGAVFEAWDHERESLVAVKILRDFNARTLFRFKQEFRGLAGIVHPNLVTLYELLQDDGRWFFTMELIQGKDFLYYARINPFSHSMDADVSEGLAEQTTLDGLPPETDPYIGALDIPAPRFDESNLRKALIQLAQGLETLHLAGKLHCDVKPSNVLVTPEERVVLLDFGLITERVEPEALRRLSKSTGGGHFFGTPHYMSPEQAKGVELTPASDWYSVGVMLYEALAGVFPIDGNSTLQVLLRKQSRTPKLLHDINPNVPEDLAMLCMKMLERDPGDRAGAREVFELLGSGQSRRSRSTSISFDQPAAFVGRRNEMRRMRDSVERLASGQGGFINVSGRSGMGKTTLARAFLDSYVHPLENVIVLEGRCHENESVPFKVFDSLVDMLSRYLEHLPGDDVLGLVPRDVTALTRLFPTLSRIDALREASETGTQLGSRQRERAFAALRELLGLLASRHRLVLFVDDVQWGDEDSATLLEHLLRPPGQ